jgi:adenylate kinase
MLRAEIAEKTALGLRIKSVLDAGDLVSDDIIIEMIAGRIAGPGCGKGFILDGFPRTVVQAEALDERLGSIGRAIDHVVVLEVDEKALLGRIEGRAAQSGGARSDDNAETLKKRLAVYKAQTAPVLPYYEKKGLLRRIDGMQGIDAVTAQIEAVLSAKTGTH